MAETIKVGLLFEAKDLIVKLYNVPLKGFTGKEVLTLRKNISKIEKEAKEVEETRNKYISENGTADEKGNITIKDTDPNFQEVKEWVDDYMNSDIEVPWEPFINDEMLEKLFNSENVEFTLRDLTLMEVLKIKPED